jgi:hypothetical protein
MILRVIALALSFILPTLAFGHCDTLKGPVVLDAKQAIAAGDVTPVLKWLKQSDEAEVRRVFQETMQVRQLSPAAQELADRFFFETVVRLHRAGEGSPYTGLRSDNPEPVIQLTDDSLSAGSPASLLGELNGDLKSELTKRFEAARKAKNESTSSVEAGRRYVAAYVDLTHFVERLHAAMAASETHAHAHE